jgi:hypothetical protein
VVLAWLIGLLENFGGAGNPVRGGPDLSPRHRKSWASPLRALVKKRGPKDFCCVAEQLRYLTGAIARLSL